jgi:hypothetical protein
MYSEVRLSQKNIEKLYKAVVVLSVCNLINWLKYSKENINMTLAYMDARLCMYFSIATLRVWREWKNWSGTKGVELTCFSWLTNLWHIPDLAKGKKILRATDINSMKKHIWPEGTDLYRRIRKATHNQRSIVWYWWAVQSVFHRMILNPKY